MADDPSLHETTHDVTTIVLAAVDQDNDAIADAIDRIGDRGGAQHLYAAMWALAEAARIVCKLPEGANWGIAGDVDSLSIAQRNAARWIAAAFAQDSGTAVALFHAPTTDADESAFLAALVFSLTRMIRSGATARGVA